MDPVTAIIVSLVLMAASTLITSLLVKKQKIRPAALEEFDFEQVEEGTPQSVCFGQCWQRGWQVLWFGQLRTVKIKAEGKK